MQFGGWISHLGTSIDQGWPPPQKKKGRKGHIVKIKIYLIDF